MPPHDVTAISYLAREDFRTSRCLFGIRQADRLFHMYAIGKTGTGKSTLLETLVRQDIAAGRGLCLIDPHGDLVTRIAASVPGSRAGCQRRRKNVSASSTDISHAGRQGRN